MNQLQKIHLKKYGVGFNSWYELNCIKPHISNESWQHFFVKCVLCYQLLLEGKEFFTEVPLVGGKKPDVINFTDRIAYEIETKAKEFRTWYDERTGFQFYELPAKKTLDLIFNLKEGDIIKEVENDLKNRKRPKIRKKSNRTKSTRKGKKSNR